MEKVLVTVWLSSVAASVVSWSVLPVLVVSAVLIVAGSVSDSLARH
jgi:hypothetical protein